MDNDTKPALEQLSSSLNGLARELTHALITQKIKLKYMGSFVDEVLQNGKRIYDYNQHRKQNPNQDKMSQEEYDELLRFAKEKTNAKKLES